MLISIIHTRIYFENCKQSHMLSSCYCPTTCSDIEMHPIFQKKSNTIKSNWTIDTHTKPRRLNSFNLQIRHRSLESILIIMFCSRQKHLSPWWWDQARWSISPWSRLVQQASCLETKNISERCHALSYDTFCCIDTLSAILNSSSTWQHNHVELLAKLARMKKAPLFVSSYELKAQLTRKSICIEQRVAIWARNNTLCFWGCHGREATGKRELWWHKGGNYEEVSSLVSTFNCAGWGDLFR